MSRWLVSLKLNCYRRPERRSPVGGDVLVAVRAVPTARAAAVAALRGRELREDLVARLGIGVQGLATHHGTAVSLLDILDGRIRKA